MISADLDRVPGRNGQPFTVGLIGTYVPRQCGIATFTADLAGALAGQGLDVLALPVSDVPGAYDYPAPVRFEIEQDNLSTYASAARFLNEAADIVCVQHEYGIFGGPDGRHILRLLRDLRLPVVTSLHTVLEAPSTGQREVMEELVALSDRVVPLSRVGGRILRERYDVSPASVHVIPHGIPDVGFIDPAWFKDQFGLAGRRVLLSFGLLSPNKGIENVVEALPQLVAEFPNLVYLVVGATHPHVLRHEGERYRDSLGQLAANLGVAEHLRFHDAYVDLELLLAFLGAADVYVTPYLDRQQIVSGTLAYAMGAGKPVVSTPYQYATEMLAGDRGILVPFRDPDAIGRAVGGILRDETARSAMRKRAYMAGRRMTWDEVGKRYALLFQEVGDERRLRPRAVTPMRRRTRVADTSGQPSLEHLVALADDVGVFQHAHYSVANRSHGYCTDDNARALSIALRQLGRPRMRRLAQTCLAFLHHAFDHANGRFRNLHTWQRAWVPDLDSEDSHGRAIAALGDVLGAAVDEGSRRLAARMLQEAMPVTESMGALRASAFSIMGIAGYLVRFPGDLMARRILLTLGERLHEALAAHAGADWHWFEDIVTYSNASLPHGLLVAGESLGRSDFTRAGLDALGWLCQVQRPNEGHFVPVGCNGFFPRGGERSLFDQQPVEAAVTISACLAAARTTGDAAWYREARHAFDWFHGANDLRVPLLDAETGGCQDGLHADRANQNQGAESTLSYLSAWLDLDELSRLELADRLTGDDVEPAEVIAS